MFLARFLKFIAIFLAILPADPKFLPQNANFSVHFFYDFFLHNTENTQPISATQTIFAQNIVPSVEIALQNLVKSALNLGVSGIFHMGGVAKNMFSPMIFLTTRADNFSMKFGIFPHDYENFSDFFAPDPGPDPKNAPIFLPNFIFADDYLFFRPFTHGLRLDFATDYSRAGLVFDWYGGDLARRIDEFYALFYADFSYDFWHADAKILLDHFKNDEFLSHFRATVKNSQNFYDYYLLDRLFYAFSGALNLIKFLPDPEFLQKFSMNFSFLNLNERRRTISRGILNPIFSHGVKIDVIAQRAGFGAMNELFFGDEFYAHFEDYGEEIYHGEPFFRAGFFNKFSLFYEFSGENLRAMFRISLKNTRKILANEQNLKISLKF